jgi:hypothetical protein
MFTEKVAILINNQSGKTTIYKNVIDIEQNITTYEFKNQVNQVICLII